MLHKGSATLKRKKDLHYRIAHATESRCADCAHLRVQEILGLNGESRGFSDYRCVIIGCENSRKYAVNPHKCVCDRYAQVEIENLHTSHTEEK